MKFKKCVGKNAQYLYLNSSIGYNLFTYLCIVSDCMQWEAEMGVCVCVLWNAMIHTPINGCRVLLWLSREVELDLQHSMVVSMHAEVMMLQPLTPRQQDLTAVRGKSYFPNVLFLF
jgi:hypothetical protein